MPSENTPEIKKFIRENAGLFWYIPNDAKENISHEVLVEFILNYGDMKSVKRLFELLSIEKVARIFYAHIHKTNPIEKNRINYLPLVRNFFDLYFQKNGAYRNSH